MKTIRLVAFLLVALPLPLQAQSPIRLEITPHVGYFAPRDDIGAVMRVSDANVLVLRRIDPGPSIGATAELTWPTEVVRTRVTGLVTASRDADGEFTCMTNVPCLAIFIGANASARIAAAVADVVVGPRGSALVRPYALFGAGVKRYSFSWDVASPSPVGGSHAENVLAVHGGIGIEWDVLGSTIRAEVSDYWSPAAGDIQPAEGSGALAVAGRQAQHDISITIGYQLFRF